jgi:SOS-response transcriptional repressor LexA
MLSDGGPRTVPDPRRLGQRIASLRHANGWSQRRLAQAAGVSHGYVALLELGRLPSPGKFRLDAVARALNLRTADALLAPGADVPAAWPEPQPGRADLLQPSSASPARGPDPPPRASEAPAPQADPALRSLEPVAPGAWPAGPGALRQPADASGGQPTGNVVGSLEHLRSPGAQLLPVFRWGSCGDPRDRESPPDPDHLEYPPPGRESLIGPHGFGVMVKGDSMAARGIYDGDVVWVNPERPYQIGKVVLALVSDASGESGMVVKTYARTEVGECLLSETAEGRSPVVCREFKVIGPVVGISSWRLPT